MFYICNKHFLQTMAKQFNTAATCDPKRHYMVDISQKMKVFERLIDNGNYFTITRARQFGKSTSLESRRKFINIRRAILFW